MKITLTIPNQKNIDKAWKKAPKELESSLSGAIARSTVIAEGQAVIEAPVDKGHLRGRMTTSITATQGEVFTTVKYAMAVHEGTKARTIYPKKKKVLAWKQNGEWRFAKKVRHPGMKANPFFKRALDKSKGKIEKQFEEAVDKVLESIAKT